MLRPHRLQDERSLVIHRLIAERIREDPGLLDQPRTRVAEWLRTGSTRSFYASAWRDLLDGPFEDLLALLVDPGERATALRHVSPFAGIVDMRTRDRIWREVRERLEAEERSTEAAP
jgi:hypothetical protein